MSTQCCISSHLYKSIRKQIWPCHKNGHGQPRVIIWYSSTRCCTPSFKVIGLLVLKKIFFTIYRHGHVTWNIWTNFHFPHPMETQFDFNWPSCFWGKEVWKCWISGTLDNRQWMTLTLSSYKLSCIYLFDYMNQLPPHRIHQFLGSLQFKRFPI